MEFESGANALQMLDPGLGHPQPKVNLLLSSPNVPH